MKRFLCSLLLMTITVGAFSQQAARQRALNMAAECLKTDAANVAVGVYHAPASKEAGVPVISAMGAGNKLDPTRFRVADIYKTSVCPLAKVMRTELKKRGVKHLKVVYSEELPIQPDKELLQQTWEAEGTAKRNIPGSTAAAPAASGLAIASEVIKDILAR